MTCVHHWYLSTSHCGVNGERITHERCKLCGGERDLVETYNEQMIAQARHTDIVYPERKVEMITKENQEERRLKHKEYVKRKEEIIAKYRDGDKLTDVARRLDIPITTLRGLLMRWGEYIPIARGTRRPTPLEVSVKDKIISFPKTLKDIPTPEIFIKPPPMIPLFVVNQMMAYVLDDERVAFWEGYKIGRGI